MTISSCDVTRRLPAMVTFAFVTICIWLERSLTTVLELSRKKKLYIYIYIYKTVLLIEKEKKNVSRVFSKLCSAATKPLITFLFIDEIWPIKNQFVEQYTRDICAVQILLKQDFKILYSSPKNVNKILTNFVKKNRDIYKKWYILNYTFVKLGIPFKMVFEWVTLVWK